MNVFLNFISQLSLQHRILLAAFVLIKILLILMVPLTGDEAYFIVWGQHLSLGYYDHPPAVGWLLASLGLVADNLTWYRSFAFFSAILIAYLLYQLVRMPADETGNHRVTSDTAMWVALAFFVSPISLMFVVTANDTVLVLFSVLGVYFFAKALHSQKWLDVLLAGLFLGMAFLSKYFAAFMLIGLLAYALWFWKKINLKQFLVMVAIVMLAVLENLYFNATHCWNNILFNFFSRTTESQFELQNVITFVVIIVMLLSPLGLWYLVKKRMASGAFFSGKGHLDSQKLVVFASLPLLLVLLFVSFTNEVGLHWPLIAVTILYVLYQVLSPSQLINVYRFNAYLSILAGLVILIALSMVDQLISPSQKHHVAVYTQPEKVCQHLPKSEQLFTLDYSSQSALSYHCGNDDVHVFASTSKFGREDDKLTNFKTMNNQTLSIFVTQEKDIEKVRPYFAKVEIKPISISEATTYYWIEGHNFDYQSYREQVLVPVNENFYTPPEWFPDMFGPCEFKQRYDFQD